jgi:two-component system, response regulator
MNQKVILLVEDNPSDELLTRRALKKAHILNDVIVARDGVEALDYLFGRGAHEGRDTSNQPTIVLLDLNLPKVGGLEVLEAMRADERTSRLAVVVLTTSREDRDIDTAYTLGVNSYIQKPVDFNQFADAVNQIGLYWLVLNEPCPARAQT